MSDTPIGDVSDTALWVAAFRATESERPDALFSDPLAATLTGERGRAIARAMPYPKMLAWVMAVRTVVIDRLVASALAQGVDTVVNIGAGLDTRPYRLDLPSALRWVEIDFPHMIDLKSARLAHATPRCQLRRLGLDVSDRDTAIRAYAEIGAQSAKALVITEGVVAYLSNDVAGQLARDLRAVPGFHFWIQDYRRKSSVMKHPAKLRTKLRNAPFRFDHEDPLGFFAGQGWKVMESYRAIEEGERLGRPFPVPFPFNLLAWMMPEAQRQEARESMGYALLQADQAD